MIDESSLPGLTATVLWLTFALALVFGAIAQRTGFCTMGAVADWVSFGDSNKLRQWLLAIGVAIIGTNLLAAAGWFDTTKSLYASPRFTALADVAGGFAFGFGMVLAGGCSSRTLVRMGGGSLKSLVVCLELGLSAFLTLRGALALPRVALIESSVLQMAGAQDLPSWLMRSSGWNRNTLRVALGLLVGGAFVAAALARRDFWRFDNLLAGFGIGIVIAGAWFVSGHIGYVAEHPQTLEEAFLATNSGRMESMSFVAPVADTLDWLMFFSDKSKTLTVGIVAVAGMVGGSALVAIASQRFHWEGFADTEDTANHIVGAVLMGFGGVTALGCTIGQGITGISTLALGSILVFFSIIAGAALTMKIQYRRMLKTG